MFTKPTSPILVLAAGTLALALSGCYESPKATLYKPGVYQGKKDPLLAKQREQSQQKQLLERFKLVQTDR